jgi:hypothetical protein
MDYSHYLGNAPTRARDMAERIRSETREQKSATHP